MKPQVWCSPWGAWGDRNGPWVTFGVGLECQGKPGGHERGKPAS